MKLKALIEKRNRLVEDMNSIVNKAVEEVRAVSDEENERVDEIEKEVRALDETIEKAKNQLDDLQVEEKEEQEEKKDSEDTEDEEVRAFAAYLRNEERASNLAKDANGAVIPKTIANRIIKRVYDMCPILKSAQTYNTKGTLDLPYWDESTASITVAYSDEFTDLESNSGKLDKISLQGFLAGALTKISRSLLNNSDFDLVDFVVEDMSEKLARFIEKELLIGTSSKVTGLSDCKQVVTAAATSAVTADELIDLQEMVPDQLQKGAMWIMNRKTRAAIRKLKDGEGRYLLQDDITSPFGKVLLGTPVYTSDNMPEMGADEVAVYYGNMKGLAVKFAETPSVQVLQEKFATQHAVGAVGWVEFDSKIQQEQSIACLKMAAS